MAETVITGAGFTPSGDAAMAIGGAISLNAAHEEDHLIYRVEDLAAGLCRPPGGDAGLDRDPDRGLAGWRRR